MAVATATREAFGQLPGGEPVERVCLRGAEGFEAAIITWGAAVQALRAPDRAGRLADLVLGHDSLEPYLADRQFFGATVGRYANRIAGAGFRLDGRQVRLAANDGANSLHGGTAGFDRRPWRIEALRDGSEPSVTLACVSPDGDGGYPGTLRARATFAVTGGSALAMTFEAESDRPTVVNLTHHGFFNLAGIESGESVLGHHLTIAANRYLPVGPGLLPLGAPAPVAGTPFDFSRPRPIGAAIRAAHEQLRLGRGYDHCFCLRGGMAPAARVEHPASGRVLELLTDQPGLQFYSGNFLDGGVVSKGRLCRQSDAFCLEPQRWPDAPNRPDYPSARLDPGGLYRHHSVYRFSTTTTRAQGAIR